MLTAQKKLAVQQWLKDAQEMGKQKVDGQEQNEAKFRQFLEVILLGRRQLFSFLYLNTRCACLNV